MSGIYRDVCLYNVPKVSVRDHVLTASFSEDYKKARLNVRLEHLGSHAAVAHQACAYNRNLADVLICLDVVELQGLLVLVQDVLRLFQVLLVEGKGDILGVLTADGLQNHVHVAVVQAAPTGKAAKRMVETTGLESRTMHSTFKIMQDNVNNLRWLALRR